MSTDEFDPVGFEGDEEDESTDSVIGAASGAVVAPWTAATIVDQMRRKRIELSPGTEDHVLRSGVLLQRPDGRQFLRHETILVYRTDDIADGSWA